MTIFEDFLEKEIKKLEELNRRITAQHNSYVRLNARLLDQLAAANERIKELEDGIKDIIFEDAAGNRLDENIKKRVLDRADKLFKRFVSRLPKEQS